MKQIYVFALVTDDCCPVDTYSQGDIVFVTGYCGDEISGDMVFDERWEDVYVEAGCYRFISDEEAKERGANVEFFRRARPYPKEIRG